MKPRKGHPRPEVRESHLHDRDVTTQPRCPKHKGKRWPRGRRHRRREGTGLWLGAPAPAPAGPRGPAGLEVAAPAPASPLLTPGGPEGRMV